MNDKMGNVIRQMLIQIFKPLVKILLRLNIPFSAVSDTLKWTYADVANSHFGINNKPPTKSRIAVITGLSRTQVDLQLKLDMINKKHINRQWHRAGRVLTGWVDDAHYTNKDGKPLILPIKGDGSINFKSLVEEYSGGATYKSIMDDLLASQAIRKTDEGCIELIKPFYTTENDPDELQKIDFLALSTKFLIETIEYNINPENSSSRFQRIITQDKLPKSLSLIAESYIREKSQELANDVDEYLEHLVKHSKLEKQPELIPNIGLGIYFCKSENKEDYYP